MNILFVGFMGAGKTALGKRLALRLGYQFLDTDAWIEDKESMTISELFQYKGEAYFREQESNCLRALASVENHVIATGGGILTTEGNLELIQKIGTSIFINAGLDRIIERVMRNQKRPLVRTENPIDTIKTLHAKRLPLYEQADINFVPEGTQFQPILSQIIQLL